MISEQSLRQTLLSVLGIPVSSRIDCAKIANNLNRLSQTYGTELSSYGYVMWAIEHGGPAAIHKGSLMMANTMEAYAQAAKSHKEDVPILLINAGKYIDRVFSTIQDPELCMERLEGMTYGYILYLLFAASGQEDLVAKYKHEAHEHFKRYPGTLAALPESFRAAGEEALRADA